MIEINVVYDPFTIIPSDWEKIEENLKKMGDRYNFTFDFDDGEETRKPNTLYITNQDTWKTEVSDENEIFVKTFSTDLIEDCIKRIEELHKEKTKQRRI